MERLDKSKSIAENKLILLYILRALNDGVNNTALTSLVLEGRYMDYFTMQQYLNELISEGYISVDDDRVYFYTITAKGLELLNGMAGLLPAGEKNRIDRSIGAIKKHIKNNSAVSSDYTPYDENRCTVTLKIEENGYCLLSVEVATGSKDDARLICKNWEENTGEIYTKIIDILTKQ